MRQRTETKPWDAAEYIESPEDAVEFLKAAFEERDPAHLMNALGTVARSKGMASIAAKTGLNRETLYRTLSADGNPELATLLKILDAMDLDLDIKPKVKDEVI